VVEFNWPVASFDVQVLATVIVQINTILDITETTTKYGTATHVDGANFIVTDITSFWDTILDTTGVVVVSGIPTLTYKPAIYTAPGQYIVITTLLYAIYAMT
jgi:hypothetical protein